MTDPPPQMSRTSTPATPQLPVIPAPFSSPSQPGHLPLPESDRFPIGKPSEVHFAKKLAKLPESTALVSLAAPLAPQAFMGAFILAAFILASLAHLLGIPGIYSAIGIGTLMALGIAWSIRLLIERAKLERGAKNSMSDPAYRLRVVGPARVAARLEDLSDAAFEPRVFTIWFALPTRGKVWGYVLYALAAIAITVGLYLFSAWLPQVLRQTILLFYAALALAAGPFAFLWPTYLRVAPGRVDLLRYRLLGAGSPTLRSWDVRHTPVLIFSTQTVLYLHDEFRGTESIQCALWPRPELIRAVLEAARSRHETPPMPEDRLTG